MKYVIGSFLLFAALACGSDVGVDSMFTPFPYLQRGGQFWAGAYVGNFGSDSASFWTSLFVGHSGRDTAYIESVFVTLEPGEHTVLNFPLGQTPAAGEYDVACRTELEGDEDSTNDIVRSSLTVVEMALWHVGITQMHLPSDSLDTLTVFQPWLTLRSFSDSFVAGQVWIAFDDTLPGPPVYSETRHFTLEPGAETTLAYPDVRFRLPSLYDLLFSFNIKNTTLFGGWSFRVVPGSDIEESPAPPVPGPELAATILSASSARRLASSVLYDVMGRTVRDPKPGVYFVGEGSGARGQGSGRMRKVLVTR